MHPTILAQRKAIATDRILERSAALVQHLELDQSLVDRLRPSSVKDPPTVEMLRLEALADLFDQLADSAGAPAAPVPDRTVREFIAPAVTAVTKPADESIPGPVPPVEGATPEGLPPPVMEGERTEGEGAAQKIDDAFATEAVAVPEPDEPSEEAPEDKPAEEPAVTAVTSPEKEPVEEEPGPQSRSPKKSTRSKKKK